MHMAGGAVFKMRHLLLIVAQVILFFHVVECALYHPSIYWTPQNPLFDRNDSVLYVLPLSRVQVVCPNPSTVMKKVKVDSTAKEYQNLWIVSRESYERCSTDQSQGSKLLLRCDTPLSLKYLTLLFQRYSAVYDFGYIPGQEYYFIATSDGSQESLDRPSGGNCQHRNMKLRIFVCLNKKDPRCNPQTTTTATTATTTTAAATTITTTTTPGVTNATSAKATTKVISTDTDIQAAILSTNPGSTTVLNTNSTSLVPIAEVGRPSSLPTRQFSSSAISSSFSSTSTKTVTQPVLARASSGDQGTSGHKRVLGAVSEMNWIIIFPLMACLLLSLIGNIILVCRLRVRQNEYCVTEKCNAIVEAAPVKHLESPKIQTRVEKALLLFRRSADVSEV
ncbi:Ephrin-B2a [Porites harrisoni]